jgi:hypothetical protein
VCVALWPCVVAAPCRSCPRRSACVRRRIGSYTGVQTPRHTSATGKFFKGDIAALAIYDYVLNLHTTTRLGVFDSAGSTAFQRL